MRKRTKKERSLALVVRKAKHERRKKSKQGQSPITVEGEYSPNLMAMHRGKKVKK